MYIFKKCIKAGFLNGASITMTDELFPSAGFKVQSFGFVFLTHLFSWLGLDRKCCLSLQMCSFLVDHPIVGPKSYTIARL